MKRYFPIPFVLLLVLASGYSLHKLFLVGFSFSWLGVSVAVIPMLGFFSYMALASVPRTKKGLPFQLCAAVAGVLLTLGGDSLFATGIAFFVGFMGSCLYVYWYTPLDRNTNEIIVGEKIPEFTIKNINGGEVNSHAENDRNKIWMFVRGNWCPLCVAQISELAGTYQKLNDLGADVFVISSQSEKESKKLARKFNVPLKFLIDESNKVATLLGVDHIGGVPFGIPGYDVDTAMPTVIITDTKNSVIFADQTDNYRVRPEPELFIQILNTNNISSKEKSR